MKLTPFIEGLFREGSVLVEGQMASFEEADLHQAGELLKQVYSQQVLEMPLTAPSFDAAPATWAAQYLYHAVQLIMIRDLDEEAIREHLKTFDGTKSSETIFSVDLVFRYLPDLFKLAKGLAPDDPLVKQLKTEALKWPFSSVGIDLTEEINESTILGHPSLRYAYMDRIIAMRDEKRLNKPELTELAREVLGEHAADLWPGLELIAQNAQ